MITDKEISLRLDWITICRLACKALCLDMSFNDVRELAMRERIASEATE